MRTSRLPTWRTACSICSALVTSSISGVHAFVDNVERSARSCIHSLCSAPQRFLDECAADAAIGAGNQDCFLCDVHDDLLLGPTLAGPILPLYWVKPTGAPKLIGAWKLIFGARRKINGDSALSALRRGAWSTKLSALWSGPGDDRAPASQSLAPVSTNATYQFFNPRATGNTHVPWSR
jgi:hypothetical protein